MVNLFFKYILLLMLLHLSQSFPICPPPPGTPVPSRNPTLSSNPWVKHISSLATPFPILFLTFPYFVPTNLYLSPASFPPLSPSPSQLITLQMDFVPALLLCWICFLAAIVDCCEFIAILRRLLLQKSLSMNSKNVCRIFHILFLNNSFNPIFLHFFLSYFLTDIKSILEYVHTFIFEISLFFKTYQIHILLCWPLVTSLIYQLENISENTINPWCAPPLRLYLFFKYSIFFQPSSFDQNYWYMFLLSFFKMKCLLVLCFKGYLWSLN